MFTCSSFLYTVSLIKCRFFGSSHRTFPNQYNHSLKTDHRRSSQIKSVVVHFKRVPLKTIKFKNIGMYN